MKLLLTSEGLTTDAIKHKLLELVGKSVGDISVAFIPTAAMPDENSSWIRHNKQPLIDLGVKTIDDVDLKDFDDKPEILYSKLRSYDVIWVNGGNTFFLLYWVKKSGFEVIIKRLLNEGKVYVGVSAGSILACPTIEIAGWKGLDDPSVVTLDKLNALNLVNFYIFVHYSQRWEKLLRENRRSINSKLIILKDEEAVLANGTKI